MVGLHRKLRASGVVNVADRRDRHPINWLPKARRGDAGVSHTLDTLAKGVYSLTAQESLTPAEIAALRNMEKLECTLALEHEAYLPREITRVAATIRNPTN